MSVEKDLLRQIEKALEVLISVDAMMEAEATMNAAKHLSTKIMPNPLASAVSTIVVDLKRTVAQYALEDSI